MKQSAERQGGALLSSQRPDSARTAWVLRAGQPLPSSPGFAAAARISKAALCFERDLVPRVPGRRRRRDTAGRLSPPSAPLAGIPRGLGLGRMVHTWVAASASLGSQVLGSR